MKQLAITVVNGHAYVYLPSMNQVTPIIHDITPERTDVFTMPQLSFQKPTP